MVLNVVKALNSFKFTPRHVSIHQHILSKPASKMLITMLPSQSCYLQITYTFQCDLLRSSLFAFIRSSIFVFNNNNPIAIMLLRLSLFLVIASSILDSAPSLFNNRNYFFFMIQTIPSMASTEIQS